MFLVFLHCCGYKEIDAWFAETAQSAPGDANNVTVFSAPSATFEHLFQLNLLLKKTKELCKSPRLDRHEEKAPI